MNMDIESYMPHRGRMKLIEDILESDENNCKAIAVPKLTWPFQRREGIDPLVIIELIAQTTSAYVGWCRRNEKKMGGAGFLVGIRSAEIGLTCLSLDSPVYISCKRMLDMDNYGVFEGRVFTNDTTYGTSVIQVYNP
jgi:predicted hotdog family 3-hydroxylacyl-ACP dehydratase